LLPKARRAPISVATAAEWQKGGEDAASRAAEGDGGPWQLGLLPFPLAEALLPGETKQVHLFEARFTRLFEDAARNHGCLGQLLLTPGGNVASITTLLEVEESRRQEIGVWAQLKCVGRVRLTSLRQSEYEYVLADVELFCDEAPSSEGDENVALQEEEGAAAQVADAYMRCHSMASRLKDVRENEATSPADGSAVDDRVEWGHETRGAEVRFDLTLDSLVRPRREALLSRGLDALPADSLLEQVQPTWKAANEAAAERQLLSFAVAAALSPTDRAQAIAVKDTVERLQHALHSLEEHEKRLAAQLALRQALS